jgi:hypothetical protein
VEQSANVFKTTTKRFTAGVMSYQMRIAARIDNYVLNSGQSNETYDSSIAIHAKTVC